MISLDEYLAAGQTTVSNLLLKNYRRLGLNTNEFMLWLQLYVENQTGNIFPDMTEIARRIGLPADQIYQILNSIIGKGFVALESKKDEAGRQADYYNVSLAFDKLTILVEQEKFKKTEDAQQISQKNMFTIFEKEFGRSLSPIEYQKIGYWLEEDGYTPELITLALQEAVLNQAYNFKYIEAVLQNWEKKNIQTKQQVMDEQKRRKQLILQKEEANYQETLPEVSLDDWLNGED